MSKEHDEAVELAKAHNQTGLRADLILGHERAKWFLSSLADHRQQVRDEYLQELAQRSGVMSEPDITEYNDGMESVPCRWYTEERVREAIASLEARLEAAKKLARDYHEERVALYAKLEQSEARVLELARALEIIAVGDAQNPQLQAAEELIALGYWRDIPEAREFCAAITKESGK